MGASGKKRENFLDKLRVAGTCAVVLLHTVTGIMDITVMTEYKTERLLFLVILDLVCWCVPVFVLISGYLFLNPARNFSFRQMLTKYCRRIVLALLLFGVPFSWLEQVAVEKAFRSEMLWRGFLGVLTGKSWSHLWYLYMILLLYLLTPALKWCLKRMSFPAVYLLLAGLLLGSSILPFLKKVYELERLWVLPDGGIYFFYYICGYLFAVQGKREKRGANAACFLAALVAAGMVCSRVVGNFEVQMAYNYPFTVALALLLFGWRKCREAEKDERVVRKTQIRQNGLCEREDIAAGYTGFWETAGALSFAVYLIHPVFLNIYYKFLHISPLDFCIWISLPLFFAGTLFPAVLAAWLFRKVPSLRKWVL